MTKYLTQKELELAILEIAEEVEREREIDAVYIPPEVDELTDEEEFSEDPEKFGENENVDIAGTFEIHVSQDSQYDESDEEPLSEKRKKLRKISDVIPKWKDVILMNRNQPSSNEQTKLENLRNELEGQSPLDIFFKFFDESVQSLIVQYSTKYANNNNRHDFSFTTEDLPNFIGILLLSGYHSLPQADLYWSTEEDKGVDIVKQCMSRNTFRNIKRNLHLSDNSMLDKNDRFSKLRPFFNIINEKFMQYGVFSHNLSVDEQMVPYFGRHSCKMFLKGKPVRFGFKQWCICSSDGYLYKFMPYGGASDTYKNSKLGLGGSVVLDLLSVLEKPDNHNIFLTTSFLLTSYS